MKWYKVLDYSQKFFNFLYPFFKETEILPDFNPWNTHFRIVNGVRESNNWLGVAVRNFSRWREMFVVLWEKRNARVSNIYIHIRIRVEILKFSCRQPPVCRGAAPITLSAHSSTYPPVSCPRYFSSSFRRRRDTWERCASSLPAHTIDFVCVHTVTYSQRGLVSLSRIDTQTSLSFSLSFSLFLLFCHARCAYTRSFFNDRINRGGAAIGDSFLPGTIAAMNDRACLPSIPPRMPFRIFVSIRSSQAAKWMRSSR